MNKLQSLVSFAATSTTGTLGNVKITDKQNAATENTGAINHRRLGKFRQ